MMINREGRWFATLYTCNYGPGGNYIRGQMYRRGEKIQENPAKAKILQVQRAPPVPGDHHAPDNTRDFALDQTENIPPSSCPVLV